MICNVSELILIMFELLLTIYRSGIRCLLDELEIRLSGTSASLSRSFAGVLAVRACGSAVRTRLKARLGPRSATDQAIEMQAARSQGPRNGQPPRLMFV
jgi:hypothetical protein